jgi:predicted  nucleic acid-binding Zn-ribbon protein
VIEIRGADVSGTRFRLRDPFTEKYLAKRGWTKTASYLPGEAVRDDGVLRLTVEADLARKISPGTNLLLEQPAADFEELLAWPKSSVDVEEAALAAAAEAMEEETKAAEPVAAAATPEQTVEEAKTTEAPQLEPSKPEPLVLDSFEPSIMHDDLHGDQKPDAGANAALLADNDNRASTWRPAAIAAAVCLLLGTGIGYVWSGSGDSAAVKQVRETAAIQLEKQKWEFDRQLKQAQEQAANATSDKTKASNAELASLSTKSRQLIADRDEARKALADKEKSIAALQNQLSDANAQITAVKNAAGDEAKAQIEALDNKIASLGADLDKAKDELAKRDQALQQAQTKLADVNDQLTASKETAKQEAEALNDDLAKQTGDLNTKLDQAQQQLAARERDLKEMQAKLDNANSEIAAVRESAKNQQATENATVTEKINTLTVQAKQNEQALAQRDAALRDLQAKLSVANIQIDALKVVANKTTEAGLEKTAMSDKLKQLSTELDKTGQELSDREQALTEATAKLQEAEAKLAAANKRNDELVADAQQDDPGQSQTQAATDENAGRLQEERDLYASELKTMTANFSALQAEKTKLEKTVADLQSQAKEASLTTSQIPSKAIWGATAIDQNGAIYSLQNQVSEKIAQENVNAMCHGKSGGRCETLSSYSNACFSVARFQGEQPASDNYAYFVHKDWKTASQTALEHCQSMGMACTVRFTACSPDMLSKPVSE